ncbi:MAG: hypothetical protein PHS84_08490 [Paludibacter sp.]|jgi:hypothetical protein|nr:hypothetical protein [Paludibacter sp.]
MQNSIHLKIADFSIKLYSDISIELEEGYLPFVSEDEKGVDDVTIHCFSGIPAIDLQKAELVFEAKNEIQKFYSIFRSDTGLGFIIYNQQTKDEVQQIAFLDETFSQWEVYSNPSSESSRLPLKYPLGPIVMHYLTVKSNSVMIHASCVFDGKTGRIFTGFSGNGKSTISKLWADAGNRIINDDRIIIRKIEDNYMAFNTPMYYIDKPKSTVLNAIFLISHSPENKMKKISGALAVSKVMAFCIQNNFESKLIQNHLDFLSELCIHIPVYELGFVPDASVVNFILANETGRTK